MVITRIKYEPHWSWIPGLLAVHYIAREAEHEYSTIPWDMCL
jgi:hypothetical protein